MDLLNQSLGAFRAILIIRDFRLKDLILRAKITLELSLTNPPVTYQRPHTKSPLYQRTTETRLSNKLLQIYENDYKQKPQQRIDCLNP